MGFDPAWFAGAITSGEMTWRALEARDAFEGSAEADARGPKPFAGDKVLHFTWSERGSIALDGLIRADRYPPSQGTITAKTQ